MTNFFHDELLDFVDALDEKPARSSLGEEDENLTDTWSIKGERTSSSSSSSKPETDTRGEPSFTAPASETDAWTMTSDEPSEPETDVWMDITNAFESWFTRIIDVESRISAHQSLKSTRIDQSIQRMLQDGLVNICDANELRFVGDSWLSLMNAYSCYSIGCRTYKRDIISALLDLFSTKQITKEAFVQICEQL